MYDILTNNNKLDLIKDRDKIINIDYLCSDGHHAYDIISNHILFKPYIKKHIISKTENKDQILENLNKEVYLFI